MQTSKHFENVEMIRCEAEHRKLGSRVCVVTHRTRRNKARASIRVDAVNLGDTTFDVLKEFHGSRMMVRYKLKDDVICNVERIRTFKRGAFSVSVLRCDHKMFWKANRLSF